MEVEKIEDRSRKKGKKKGRENEERGKKKGKVFFFFLSRIIEL